MVSIKHTGRSTVLIVYDEGWNARFSKGYTKESDSYSKATIIQALQDIGTTIKSIKVDDYIASEITYD